MLMLRTLTLSETESERFRINFNFLKFFLLLFNVHPIELARRRSLVMNVRSQTELRNRSSINPVSYSTLQNKHSSLLQSDPFLEIC